MSYIELTKLALTTVTYHLYRNSEGSVVYAEMKPEYNIEDVYSTSATDEEGRTIVDTNVLAELEAAVANATTV